MRTEILTNDIARAAEIIKSGGLVAVPTETVYGLAGNGMDELAVARIYEVKGRPEVKPLSLMVPDTDALDRYCLDVPPQARALANRFWPGPLTIVLRAKDTVSETVRAGGDTVGLRCPDHPLTLELLRRVQLPLAAPSANLSGEPSPKTAGQVLEALDGQIEAVLDGGRCGIGVESTVIDMTQTPYRVLRAGATDERQIFAALAAEMNVIGITGGTGCGKTTALEVLRGMGALVIDCDAVYHELLETGAEMLGEIDARFPGVVENGRLQRKALGAVVFADAAALADLNAITHRYVIEEVERRLADWARCGGTTAAIDAIALIESGLAALCSSTVGVTAPRSERIVRLIAREGISAGYAESRINAQKPDGFFEENCGYVLRNDSDRESFEQRCRELFEKIQQLWEETKSV